MDCLEFLPDELVVDVSRGLSTCADDLLQCKKLLYEVLAQHYRHPQQPPLLSNHVFDIHTGISELLGKRRRYQCPVVLSSVNEVLMVFIFHICFCPWHFDHSKTHSTAQHFQSCAFCGQWMENKNKLWRLCSWAWSCRTLAAGRSYAGSWDSWPLQPSHRRSNYTKRWALVSISCASVHVYVWSLLTWDNSLSDWEQNGFKKIFLKCHRVQQETLERESGPDGFVHDG